MKTEKLYDVNAYLSEFCATVLSCENKDGKYETVLDKTAFFPEAGGQPCDIGEINGIEVFDVKIESGIIYHYTKSELKAGESVNCKIDFKRRFSFMQNHSGEHIVSGIINKLYGLSNVGFHLNEEFVTLDFDGLFDRRQLDDIEYKANEVIWQNKKIKTYYPSESELKNLVFRQKKEIDGDVRIVEIEETDMCACCAPHVKSTGEIGLIKLLNFEKMRGGVRIYMKCGSLALKDYQNKFLNVSRIQALLSAKPEETADAVETLIKKTDEEKQKTAELKRKLAECIVKSAERDKTALFLKDFDMKEICALSDMLFKEHKREKIVLSEVRSGAYLFAICAEPQRAQDLFNIIKENLSAKGGGRNGMISGTVTAGKEEIKGVLSRYELD